MPQFTPGLGRCAESSDLLGLGEDHEMDFEVFSASLPPHQSPVGGAHSVSSSPNSEGQPRQRRRVRAGVVAFMLLLTRFHSAA